MTKLLYCTYVLLIPNFNPVLGLGDTIKEREKKGKGGDRSSRLAFVLWQWKRCQQSVGPPLCVTGREREKWGKRFEVHPHNATAPNSLLSSNVDTCTYVPGHALGWYSETCTDVVYVVVGLEFPYVGLAWLWVEHP